MSNGTYPPDDQPEPDPITGRVTYTCACTICGKVWDRGINAAPPCAHTQAEMDAIFNANPPGQDQRQRWKVTTPPVPASVAATRRAEAEKAKAAEQKT